MTRHRWGEQQFPPRDIDVLDSNKKTTLQLSHIPEKHYFEPEMLSSNLIYQPPGLHLFIFGHIHSS